MTASKKAGSFRPHTGGSSKYKNSSGGRGPWRPAAQAVAIALAATSGTALAQQQGALEEVIVTAEFRQANVQDTPIAITAVTSTMMEARSQTNVFEIAAQAPNVTLKPAGAGIGPAMIAFIRGIGQTDFNYALEPGVGVYVDDVYYPTLTGTLLDLLDLDRVEVLRGPQGTLAGRNSIGGAIKLYSRQPSEDGGGSISLTYGSLDRVEVRGSSDFTIVPDKLYARVAGVSRSRDGYVKRLDYRCVHPNSNVPSFSTGRLSDCKLGTEGGQNYTGGRFNLTWLPSDTVRVTLIADAINDQSETQPNVLIKVNENITVGGSGPFDLTQGGFLGQSIAGSDGNPVHLTNAFVPYGPWRGDTAVNDGYVSYATYMDPNAFDPDTLRRYSPVSIPPISTLDQRGISATIDWQINDRLSFKSITAVREYQSSFAQDVDGSPINSQMLLQHLDHEQKSQEFRLSGVAANDRLDYTVGAFFFKQEGTLEANVNLYYVQFNFIHGPDPTPSHNYAAFAHLSYALTDRLKLSAGIRYSDDEKTYVHFRRNPDGTLPAAPCLADLPPHFVGNAPNCALFGLFNQGATWEDTRTDWRVVLDWRLSDQVMTYGQVATGYKGGGVNPRPFVLPQLLPFNSEELTSYEIGFKSQLLDRSMRLNGAVFYNDYTDIILTLNPCPQIAPGPCALPVNAGTADVKGLELEMEYYPTDRWSIDASVGYLDFEYKTTAENTGITPGMVPPFTPELSWSAGIQYTFPQGERGQWSIRYDASYQDDIHTGPINTQHNRIESYTLSNMRVMWRSADEMWDAALEVTNLTDKYYYLTYFDQYESGGGTLSGQPGLPRLYGVTVRRHF